MSDSTPRRQPRDANVAETRGRSLAAPAGRHLTAADRGLLAAGTGLAILLVAFLALHPSFVIAIVFLDRMIDANPIWSHAPAGPRALWKELVTLPMLRAELYFGIVVAMAGLQLVARRMARHSALPVAWIVAVSFALASLALVTALPVQSTDIFTYLTIAELSDDRGLNPYETRPCDHPDLPSLRYGPAVLHGSIYGPLATRLFSLLHSPGQDAGEFVLRWKLLLVLLTGVTVWLLWDCWRTLGRAPPERHALLVTIAWSPLVLFESALNGHVDVIAGFLIALGLRQFLRGREVVGLVVLASTVAVKATFVVLWPAILARAFFAARTRRRGLARAALVAAAAGAFYVAWLLPDRLSWSHLSPLLQTRGWKRNTLSALIGEVAKPLGMAPIVNPLVRGALVLFLAFRPWAVMEREAFLRRLTRDFLAYVLVFGQFFYPWYLIPAFVLVVASDGERLRHAVLWAAAASLAVLPAAQLAYQRSAEASMVVYVVTLLPATVILLFPDRLRASNALSR